MTKIFDVNLISKLTNLFLIFCPSIKVQCTGNVKKEHLQSTNLIHLNAVVDRLSCAKDAISVMKPFKYQNLRLEVDIVCNNGASWVKVIARNAKALTMISLGNGEYGQKSVLDQANAYLMCSKRHLYHYKPPDVVFHFAYGIETPLALCLEQMNIIVEGDKIDADDKNLYSQYDCINISGKYNLACNIITQVVIYKKHINAVFAILSKLISNLNFVRIIYNKNIIVLIKNAYFLNLYLFV